MKIFKKYLKNILSKKLINDFLINIFVYSYDLSYGYISKLAKIRNKGKHPKHSIMNYHEFFLKNVNKNDVVLDIGCGNGSLTYDLGKESKGIIGIDINPKKIKKAKRDNQLDNIDYIAGDATKVIKTLYSDIIDTVTLSNTLEHIENRIDFLKDINNLKYNKLLIRVPLVTRSWLSLWLKSNHFKYRLDKTHFIEYSIQSFKHELEISNIRINNYSIQFGEIWACCSIRKN